MGLPVACPFFAGWLQVVAGKLDGAPDRRSSRMSPQPMSPLPVDMMDSDWWHEQHRAVLLGQFDAWREVEPALAAFRNPAAAVRFLRGPGAGARKDEILCALLRYARWEPLAGRVVLEAILPGLKNMAGRLLVDVRDREELWSVLMACAWEHIRAYPVARRPRRVAANLLLDCLRGTLTALAYARRDPAALACKLTGELVAEPTGEGV